MYTKIEKKQFVIFLLVAYGLTYVMGLFMWYGNRAGTDLSAFPNAQMLYPAAGVALAYLLTMKKERQMPRGFYVVFVFLTVLMAVLSLVSLFCPLAPLQTAGGSISMWTMVIQGIIIVGSILCWIFLLAAGKARRENGGLRWKSTRGSFFCIVLFFVIYMARSAVSFALSGQIGNFLKVFAQPYTWINLAALIPNFFLVFVAFFGE